MGFPDEREVLITYLLEMAMVMCRCEKFGNGKRRSLSRELNLFSQETFLGIKLGPIWSHSANRGLPEAKNLPHHCFHATLPPPPSFGYLQSSLQNHLHPASSSSYHPEFETTVAPSLSVFCRQTISLPPSHIQDG